MGLEQDLQQEQVTHLDLSNFTSVESGTSIRAAIEKMKAEDTHCTIIVNKDNVMMGIFTDRDILQKVVDQPGIWDQSIDEVMTPSPKAVNLNDPADAALAMMDHEHFRNVPVVDKNGIVVGNLTHYAVIKYLADRFPESVYNLPPDPDRVTHNRDGA